MEIRISGKNSSDPGYCSLSAWIRKTKDERKVLIISLGDLKISMYPYSDNCVRELGKKLQELVEL